MAFYQRSQWWMLVGIAVLDTLIPFLSITALGLVILAGIGSSAMNGVIALLKQASGEEA